MEEVERRFSPLSLIMPCVNLIVMIRFAIWSDGWGIFELIFFIPVVISAVLIIAMKTETGCMQFIQAGAEFAEVLLVMRMMKVLDVTDFSKAVEEGLLLLSFILPAAINTILYQKFGKSWKKTAVLILSDLAFVWLIFGIYVFILYLFFI